MAFRLYKRSIRTNTSVSFRLLDKHGAVIKSYTEYACFSPVTYAAIPADCTSIVVHKRLSLIPYSKRNIVKWITELNVLGFPCAAAFDDKTKEAVFTVDLARFNRKMHVSCTLQLIRCLFETGICFVPELYFSQFAANGKTLDDKWAALQDAHKAIHDVNGRMAAQYREALDDKYMYANQNHMCTYRGNGQNVSRETFWKRIDATNHDVYASRYTSLDGLWRG